MTEEDDQGSGESTGNRHCFLRMKAGKTATISISSLKYLHDMEGGTGLLPTWQ